jgi:hypothetical protein
MSIEEEHYLMARQENKAINGQILSGIDIRKIVEHKLNNSLSIDYIWDLLTEMVGQSIRQGPIIL